MGEASIITASGGYHSLLCITDVDRDGRQNVTRTQHSHAITFAECVRGITQNDD